MAKMIDETGNRYGKLAVVRQAESKRGRATWLCRCDCGNEKTALGVDLRRGHTNSCGCLAKFPEGEAALNGLFAGLRYGAEKRGYEWALSKEDVRQLTSRPCHYCGIEPIQRIKKASYNGDCIYNGLDRVDNDRGYLIDNIVPCCGTCNKMKNNMTQKEFLDHIQRIFNTMFIGGRDDLCNLGR